MNISLPRETLFEPLQLVIGVVERRQTLPILANVLLTVEDNTLSITATDLEIELIGKSQLEQPHKERQQLTLPGRKLFDICRALPDKASIDLQQDKDKVILRSGRSRFTLSTLPVESFPSFESSQTTIELGLEQRSLNDLLQRTHFAMAQQDVRYYLNGMMFEIKQDKLTTVATDGHRFALHSFTSAPSSHSQQVILPRKGVSELMRLLKNEDQNILTSFGENHVRVQGKDFTFTSKLIDGRFPDYQKVLSKTTGQSIVLNRELLREALMRVSILCNEKFRAVRLGLRANLLQIIANSEHEEEAEEFLSIDYAGEEFEIAFNVSYLLDVLNTINSTEVKLTFIDTNSRMLMEEVGESNSLYLIMPLQL